MKKGLDINQLAAELTRIEQSKQDVIVPVGKMSMDTDTSLKIDGLPNAPLNGWSHQQLSTYTDIPKGYYDRIRAEKPALLADNVNHGLSTKQGDKRLVRLLDGNVRALLSNRYRTLDSFDLASTVLPIMLENQMSVISSNITEKNLYIRAVMPKLEGEVKKGDIVQYGLQIATSDVGAGSLRVEPFVYRLVCLNGLIMDQAIRKYHIGRAIDSDDIYTILADKTREISDLAFWSQVRDIVLHSLKPEIFQAQIEQLKSANERVITNYNLEQVIDVTCKSMAFSTTKEIKQGILAALANGNENAGLTAWGLANSFTRVAAHDENVSFEDSVELERVAGKIITLSDAQWRAIAA